MTWDHFELKTRPEDASGVDAATDRGIDRKYGGMEDLEVTASYDEADCVFRARARDPKAEAWGLMRTEGSWVDPKFSGSPNSPGSKSLLNHERGHVRIAEIYGRRITRAFRATVGVDSQ